jgi:hypothetical protein
MTAKKRHKAETERAETEREETDRAETSERAEIIRAEPAERAEAATETERRVYRDKGSERDLIQRVVRDK